MCGKRLEALEDHAHFHAHLVDVHGRGIQVEAVHHHGTGGDALQAVDGPKERGLARTAGAMMTTFSPGCTKRLTWSRATIVSKCIC